MTFPSIRLEGTILSPDLLDAIERADKHGQETRDFGFEPGTKVKDEIATTWATAKALWTAYQAKLANLREGATGTTETRNLFVIPLLSLLGYSPELAEAEILHGKSYAISHRDTTRESFPIHITGPHAPDQTTSADRSTLDLKLKGGTRMSPHALVQEYLNLTEHLYGLVTNGHKIRLLRDSSRLIKLSFLEFDFERMFEEELFADFALLYRLLHASRMPATMQEAPRSLIERYHQDALDSGSRIRDGLAEAVAFAMETIANGLLSHPENKGLLAEIDADPGHAALLHQNLLRWVYRTLFLLVIEERGLNHHPDATLRQRRIYRDYYSLQRLRRLADRPRLADRRHSDLWRSMHQTLRLYEDGGKGRPLGIEPLGSFLFREEGLQPLFQYQLDNRTLLTALNRLSIFKHPDTANFMRVNYGALDVEEFGSIYESLLELRPRILPGTDHPAFQYAQLAGNERKTTGSYYTPDSLVQQLISTALDPVLEERLKEGSEGFQPSTTQDERRKAQESALLSLKVCDPAVGSGHFLIAAAHRLSRRLAEIRAGDEALSLDVQRHALRDVVSHCLYGVDINPLSVELCKVSLWMLAMEPGKPLSFLDHHIQCGNALLGATPEVLEKGIPDAAFKPIEGDDKDYCKKFKAANKEERKLRGQAGDLFDRENKPWERLGNLPEAIAKLDTLPDDTPEAVRKKAETYENAVRSADYLNARFLHDAWCAAFVWKKCPPEDGGFDYPITNGELAKIERNPHSCPPWMREETQRLARQYQFFHWHLVFPEVFGTAKGGFDIMLGNPPWEQVEQDGNPTQTRSVSGIQHFFSTSDCYPVTGNGRKNLYALFTELTIRIRIESGSVGLVLPTAVIQDKPACFISQSLFASSEFMLLADFENRRKLPNQGKWFEDVHPQYRFSIVVLRKTSHPAKLIFNASSLDDLDDQTRYYYQTLLDIESFCYSGFKIPMFRGPAEAALAKKLHISGKSIGELSYHKTPTITSSLIFNAEKSTKSQRITPAAALQNKPACAQVYEGTFFSRFDHRFASWSDDQAKSPCIGQKETPSYSITTQYYLPSSIVEQRLNALQWHSAGWLLVLRRQARATDSFVSISSIIPRAAVEGSATVFFPSGNSAALASQFCSNFNSFAFNYLASLRQSGPNLNKNVYEHLPIVIQLNKTKIGFLTPPNPQALELTYTAWDLEPFAVDCGYDGPPFRWDEERRFQLRCELDALFFHLYLPCHDSGAWKPARIAEGAVRDETEEELTTLKSHFPTPRDAVAYIMDTFPIVRKKDLKATEQKDESGNIIQQGTYRTKDRILEVYDQMLEARRTGTEWKSPLEISPASFRVAHPPRFPDPGPRATYDNDDDLWNQFVRQFLLQARHEANLNLLAEAWQLFANPKTLFERRADALPASDAETWKTHLASQVPKQGFHQWVGKLNDLGFIHVDRETLAVILPEDSALRQLDRDEWINYEVSLALAELAARPDINELLTGDTRAPEAGKILEFIAAA